MKKPNLKVMPKMNMMKKAILRMAMPTRVMRKMISWRMPMKRRFPKIWKSGIRRNNGYKKSAYAAVYRLPGNEK